MKKFFSRKIVVASSIVFAVLLFAFSGSHPVTGTGGYTGAPNDGACTQCHTPGGSITGTINITGLPATVDPNTAYPLTVTITDTSPGGIATRSGFQMVSLKANLANGGTFAVPAGETNMIVKTVNSKSYIGHQPAKNFGAANVLTFNVNWTSPTEAIGPIGVYAGAIIANGANGNSNDRFVATNVTTELGGTTDPLAVTFSNVSDAQCSDSSDGAATANPTGGTGGYSYAWDNGESNATATMLAAGPHAVTITDSSNGMIVGNVTISAPALLTVSIVNQSDAQCNGENSGSATLSAQGGTAGYTYNWGSGITGAVQNSLFAGTYNVAVSDLNQCQTSITVVIGQPSPITINLITDTEPSCNGDSDGSLEVLATGGTGSFTYNWLTGGQGTASGNIISDLPAGTYTVEAFDQNGCVNSLQVSLGQPSVIIANATATPVSCNGGSDGTATVNQSGGTGSYTYVWSTGGTGSTESGLSAGSYSVTVIDANNCQATTSVTVSQPSESVSVGITVTNQPNCGNSDGSLSAFGQGGTPGYSFLWSTGEIGATLIDIPSGSYSVTATDINGCTASATQQLMDNQGIALAANDVINNDCFGGAMGAATISASGGSGVYSYLWSTGATSATVTDLAAGTYTITVMDNNSCNGEITIEITEPNQIIANGEITNITCNGANNGVLVVNPSGGTGTISIAWNIGASENTITDLAQGQYSVTLTDENGCESIETFVIMQPDAIDLDMVTSTVPNCPGDSTGMIMIVASGGTGTLSYLWSNGASTASIFDLIEGDYTVTITDENDCTFTSSFTLDDPIEITFIPNITPPLCADSEDGSIIVTVAGGAGGYTYLWNTGVTKDTIMDIAGGTYGLTITDILGCEKQTNIVIDAPPLIEPNITGADVSANGAADGSAMVAPTNGIAPYSYLWSNAETSENITNLEPGVYDVTITDANGCTVSASIAINNGDCNIEAEIDRSNVSCFGESDGIIAVSLTNAVDPITYLWSTGATTATITDLDPGNYAGTITDANGCVLQVVDIVINEPLEIVLSSVEITDASTPAAMDGSIVFSVMGGTGQIGFEYRDEDGNVLDLDNLENLGVGIYGITAIDASGCEKDLGTFEVGALVSTQDVELVTALYPNPTSGITTIETNTAMTSDPVIYDMKGQKINVQISKSNGRYELDLSDLQVGVYLIKLTSAGQSELQRILVNR